MMEVVLQVFGGAGLVETIVEVAYVASSWEKFNSFEGRSLRFVFDGKLQMF